MFCNQCSQTPVGGCTKIGVCGKNEDLASLQDTIVLGLKGVAPMPLMLVKWVIQTLKLIKLPMKLCILLLKR